MAKPTLSWTINAADTGDIGKIVGRMFSEFTLREVEFFSNGVHAKRLDIVIVTEQNDKIAELVDTLKHETRAIVTVQSTDVLYDSIV